MTVFTRQMINPTPSCQSLKKKKKCQICAGHKVSAANDVWCLDFARTPAESLKVYSQNSLIITVDRARFMYWQTCQTFNPQSQSNVMRIHRWLMPEHTFIANELRGTCVGLLGASIDLGGRRAGGASTWLVRSFREINTCHPRPYIGHPPLPLPRHRSLFPRKPGGRGGQRDERAALANTQGSDIWSASHNRARAEGQQEREREKKA